MGVVDLEPSVGVVVHCGYFLVLPQSFCVAEEQQWDVCVVGGGGSVWGVFTKILQNSVFKYFKQLYIHTVYGTYVYVCTHVRTP